MKNLGTEIDGFMTTTGKEYLKLTSESNKEFEAFRTYVPRLKKSLREANRIIHLMTGAAKLAGTARRCEKIIDTLCQMVADDFKDLFDKANVESVPSEVDMMNFVLKMDWDKMNYEDLETMKDVERWIRERFQRVATREEMILCYRPNGETYFVHYEEMVHKVMNFLVQLIPK